MLGLLLSISFITLFNAYIVVSVSLFSNCSNEDNPINSSILSAAMPLISKSLLSTLVP